ncbi:unnamed protein product [Prunus armeniaca]
MGAFFQRLSKGTAITFNNSFGGQLKSKFCIPYRAHAATFGGVSYICLLVFTPELEGQSSPLPWKPLTGQQVSFLWCMSVPLLAMKILADFF